MVVEAPFSYNTPLVLHLSFRLDNRISWMI
jgi:hypothetical protein